MGGKNILTYLRYKCVSCRPGCDGSKPDRRSCDGSKPLPVASLGPRRAGCRRPPPSPARLRTATAMPSPVATADTVAAAAVAHNYRRRASTCCLQHLAAPPAAVAFIWMLLPPSCVPLWPSPFTVGCHLWDAARGALQFQCSPCAVALSCWWLELHCLVHRS